jgi:hypothetical protein
MDTTLFSLVPVWKNWPSQRRITDRWRLMARKRALVANSWHLFEIAILRTVYRIKLLDLPDRHEQLAL